MALVSSSGPVWPWRPYPWGHNHKNVKLSCRGRWYASRWPLNCEVAKFSRWDAGHPSRWGRGWPLRPGLWYPRPLEHWPRSQCAWPCSCDGGQWLQFDARTSFLSCREIKNIQQIIYLILMYENQFLANIYQSVVLKGKKILEWLAFARSWNFPRFSPIFFAQRKARGSSKPCENRGHASRITFSPLLPILFLNYLKAQISIRKKSTVVKYYCLIICYFAIIYHILLKTFSISVHLTMHGGYLWLFVALCGYMAWNLQW